jgi:hypothetical protein
MPDYANGDYIYSTHWLSAKRAIAGNGILSGMGVTENAPPDMDVIVAAGVYYSDGTRRTYAGGTVTILAADATYNRWDIITADASGVTYTDGVAGPLAQVPEMPNPHDILIAAILVTGGTVAIQTANIYQFGYSTILLEHMTRHLPGGADALTTGAASDIGTANAEGVAAALARQDHIHKIPNLGITTALIDNGAVTTGKIAALAVTEAEIANTTITHGKVAAANKDGAAGTPSMRTLGTGALQACAGNDARLSDSRTPVSHGHALHTDRIRRVSVPLFSSHLETGLSASTIISSGGNQYYGILYPKLIASTAYAWWSIDVMYDLILGGTYTIWLALITDTAGTTGNVVMQCAGRELIPNIDSAETTFQTTIPTSKDRIRWSAFGSITVNNSYGVQFRLRRRCVDAADTAGDVLLAGILIQYVADM